MAFCHKPATPPATPAHAGHAAGHDAHDARFPQVLIRITSLGGDGIGLLRALNFDQSRLVRMLRSRST